MKQIILNGCSWVAGDEIVWDKFCDEYNLGQVDYLTFYSRYANYRKKYNQGSMLADRLGTNVIDLSLDGNSNDGITLGTISYINTIPFEERKNYHIIIGWTSLERKLLYLDKWENCHLALYTQGDNWLKWKDRFAGSIIEETDNDWYMNYYKNVLLLESYAKVNNISYTFYRSLGSYDQFFYTSDKNPGKPKLYFTSKEPKLFNVNLHNLLPESIDKLNWMVFFDKDKDIPLCSDSWTSFMHVNFPHSEWIISEHNMHPNLRFTSMLVDKLCEYMKERNCLN
jgi:hypothetical protein